MRAALGTILLALATATGGLVALPAAQAAQAAQAPPADGVTTRIMLAGDSITQGFDGDFTWRYRLYEELTRQQVPFDFVGPRTEPYGGRNTYLAHGWDTDHDAKGGTSLAAQLGHITADMTTYQPDVVVALYGTNDLYRGATPDVLMARWQSYVEKVRAVRPDVRLVLGETYAGIAIRHARADRELDALAQELSTPESPVVVAHLDGPDFSASRDTYDGTHPTPTGEMRIAQRVAQALQQQGVLPETPAIPQAYVPWTPPMRAAVHRVGNRLRLDWASSKGRYRAWRTRVRWTEVRTGRSTTTPWDSRLTHLTTPALAGGLWRVQLQGRRGTMTARWGPAVMVRL